MWRRCANVTHRLGKRIEKSAETACCTAICAAGRRADCCRAAGAECGDSPTVRVPETSRAASARNLATAASHCSQTGPRRLARLNTKHSAVSGECRNSVNRLPLDCSSAGRDGPVQSDEQAALDLNRLPLDFSAGQNSLVQSSIFGPPTNIAKKKPALH